VYDVDVLDYKLLTPDQQKKAQYFCKEKYFKYVLELTDRLNFHHRVKYDSKFWSKALNFWLYRNICITYDKYIALREINLDSFDLSILDESSFTTPKTCDQSLKLLSFAPYGVEQLASIYFNLFSSQKIKTFSLKTFDYSCVETGTTPNLKSISKFDRLILFFKKLAVKRKIINKLKKGILRIVNNQFTAKIGLLEAYISTDFLLSVSFKSLFTIQEIQFPSLGVLKDKAIDEDSRSKIFQFEKDFDDFDKYFFESMKSLMPCSFIENFDEIYSLSNDYDNNMSHIISEAWLGNEFLSIKLAIMQRDNIKHIHTQHGWVHFNSLNLTWLESYLCDVYLTSGFGMSSLPNVERGGYVREKYPVIKNKYRDGVVFFSTTSPAYTYQIDENIRDLSFFNYLNKQINFIGMLKNDLFKEFYYRKYPVDHGWGELGALTSYFPNLKFDNIHQRGLDRLINAKLVIFDVFSTGYIEALIANTPTVIIFDKDIRQLSKEFEHLIDRLSEINIVFYNIDDAARHINAVYENPFKWWDSEEVQREIKIFLESTARDRKYSENYILKLLK